MKVFIGKYKTWIGPYQLANIFKLIGVNDDRCHEIGEMLSNTWISSFLNWIDSKKKRKIKVKIHDYDVWSMDHTLGTIILPMLLKLKASKHGSPMVDNDDVPEHLRDSELELEEFKNFGKSSDKLHARWDWVVDEMIFAFTMKCEDDWESKFYTDHGESSFVDLPNGLIEMKWAREPIVDRTGITITQTRISNGFRLFGKYYESLWT